MRAGRATGGRRRLAWLGAVFATTLVATACGDDSPDTASPEAESSQADAGETDEDEADDGATADGEDAAPSGGGGGSATITVDGETYTFPSVQCAFGPDEIGDEDAEFVLSAIDDGLQLYLSIDGFGHSMTLDDIDDFENPRVGWAAQGSLTGLTGGPEEFIVVDGKQVTAEAPMLDSIDELSGTQADGSMEGTCP